MENLTAGALTIEAADAGDSLRMRWKGRCTDRNPAKVLSSFFTGTLTAAAARGVPIEMNFEELEYLNSSAITVMIHFLREAHRQGIRLILIFNPALRWQKLTADAVRALSRDNPLLEVRP